MRKLNSLLLILFVLFSFASCLENENNEAKVSNIYIMNYGSYDGAKSEISAYDEAEKQISHNLYKTINGVDFSSNIQSIGIYEGIAYFMSNNGDKIDMVDAETFLATSNPISTDITKPRYFAAKGNYGYASCYGEVGTNEWSTIPNGYIAKIDLTTKAVVKKIAIPGGVEGIKIVGDKLYGAGYSMKKLAVVDLSTDEVSYIDLKAIARHLAIGNDNELWVSLVDSYLVPTEDTDIGVQVINTKTDQVTGFINFPGLGSNGYIYMSKDKKTLYAMGAEAWPGTATTIYEIDTKNKTIADNAFIEGESFYGFGVNPSSEKIYVLISPSTTENGTLKVYNKDGSLYDEQTTGIGPQHVVFN